MAAGVTPKDIWDELRAQGASVIQAAGIMGNMISESGLNPEAVQQGVADPGYGLVQWEASSYPAAPGLVTGNPQKDMQAQITYLAQTGGFSAADGSSPTAAGQAFAQNYEKCAECGPGGTQTNLRGIQAATVAGWASAGDFPAQASQATTTAQITSAESAETQSECLWRVSWGGVLGIGSVNVCVLSKTQARALIGAGLVATGGVTVLAAVAIFVSMSLSGTKLGKVATAAIGFVPGVGPVAAGAADLASSAGAKPSNREIGDNVIAQKEAREARQYDEVMARQRDSRKGAAPRELEPVPF